MAVAGLMLLARGRSATNLLDELRRWSDVFGQVAGARNGVEALMPTRWVYWPKYLKICVGPAKGTFA